MLVSRLTDRPFPDTFASGSFFRVDVSLQSSFFSTPACSLSSSGTSTRAFVPLRDIAAERPLGVRIANSPLCSVRRLSQPLDGLLRSAGCGFIPSHSHVQDFPVQGLLSPRSRPLSSRGTSPMPLDYRSLPIRRWSRVRWPSTSRPCSARSSIPPARWLAQPLVAPLVGFFLLQVAVLALRVGSPPRSAHGINRSDLQLSFRYASATSTVLLVETSFPTAFFQRALGSLDLSRDQPARGFSLSFIQPSGQLID
jgi:hypothetical protein